MANVGQELASVPFDEMIIAMGTAIAEAQFELDRLSARNLIMMSGLDKNDKVDFNGQQLSLLELGFVPTFYQFVDTLIEVKMVVKMSQTRESSRATSQSSSKVTLRRKSGWFSSSSKTSISASTTTVDAKYSSKYNFSAEGSSLMRTKLVPIPPPAILQERINRMIEEELAQEASS